MSIAAAYTGLGLASSLVSVLVVWRSTALAWAITDTLRHELAAFVLGADLAFHRDHTRGEPARIAWARELQHPFPYDPKALTGVGAVIRSGRTEFIAELDESTIRAALDASPELNEEELRSVLEIIDITSAITVPLVTRAGVVGAVQFVSAESKRRYDADDVTLAEAAAALRRLPDHREPMGARDRRRLRDRTTPSRSRQKPATRFVPPRRTAHPLPRSCDG